MKPNKPIPPTPIKAERPAPITHPLTPEAAALLQKLRADDLESRRQFEARATGIVLGVMATAGLDPKREWRLSDDGLSLVSNG